MPEVTRVKPRFAPRDVIDVLVGVPCSAVILALLVVSAFLAIGAVAAVWNRLTDIPVRGQHVLAAGLACLIAAFPGITVWRLDLDSRGIRFVRLLGSPRFVAWSDIDEIAPASRREVVLKGWLWPPYPPREATTCMSAIGHYRIRYRGKLRYFPPRSVPEFADLVERYRSGAGAHSSA